jgi:hypothetical protein
MFCDLQRIKKEGVRFYTLQVDYQNFFNGDAMKYSAKSLSDVSLALNEGSFKGETDRKKNREGERAYKI